MTKADIKPVLAKRAPTREMGYAVQYPGDYWFNDVETTPELRWPLCTRVYDRMRRQDAQVASILRALTLPILRTGWRLDPNGARPEVVQHIADDLRLPIVGQDAHQQTTDEDSQRKSKPRARGRFSWTEHARLALLMVQYGHMFFEQVYRISDDGRAHLAKLAPRMPQSIAAITVAADGGLVSISQYAMGTVTGGFVAGGAGNAKEIPVSRLVGYIYEREGGVWIGSSVLRPAYKNWMIKDRLLRVQAQTIERNGMGIPSYKLAPQETDTAAGQAIATGLRAGDSSGVAMPNGADLQLLGIQGQIPDANTPIRYHDEQIARSILAHFLNLGTQTGSWALGSTFADFFVMSLQTLAQAVADTANQHIVEDLVDLNWGPDEPAPLIVFDEIGSMHDATAEAIATLVAAGVLLPDSVLERAVRVQFGLPDKQPGAPEAEPKPPAPEPVPSPGPAIDGPDDPEDDGK
ncbi:DUF935 family protein [Nocardia sp. NPDC046763]|uniref:phage portal protein family protein n=1 Tax=Nocardia sp. NPDC046763 TaxID=3155256 RepID=UPI0033CD7A5A